MKKSLTFALAFSCLALGPNQSSIAQDASRTPVSVAESGNREQDRLNGSVRRVRVETVKIIMKDGKWVEGPRQVLGMATYDPAGKKIDSVAYPLEASTLPGKQHFIYDDRGNVVEMILRSDDGLMLSKEIYQYEFDQLGNWTKMSTSVAVFENGEISFEPTGVTYRTISYYYNQAIEELNAASPNSAEAPSDSLTRFPTPSKSSTDSPRSSIPSSALISSTGQPLSEAVNAHAKKEPVTEAPPVLTARSNSASSDAAITTSTENPTTPDDAPATNVVQHVAEDVLRNAAIELPQPEFSDAAMLARASGKVKVQILVDKDGQVTNAQATAGHPLLTAAAEAAARKARFSLPKASSGATKAYGVISYDFILPTPTNEAVRSAISNVDRNSPTNEAVHSASSTIDKNQPTNEALRSASSNVDRNSPTNEPVHSAGSTIDKNQPTNEALHSASSTIDKNQPTNEALRSASSTIDRNSPTKKPVHSASSTIDKNQPTNEALRSASSTIDKNQPTNEALRSASSTIDKNPRKPDERKPVPSPISEGAAFTESKSKAPANYSEAARPFYDQGVVFQALERYSDAAEAFNRAIKVDPNNANAYARLGMAYSAMQKHKDAIVVYKMALQTNRRALDAAAYYMWGHSYLALDKNSDALSAFKQALYLKKAEAIDPEKKETHLYPSLEQVHYGMAIGYLNSRRFSDSIDELTEVVSLNPKNAQAHYSLAIAYLSSGNRRKSEAHQRTLASLDPALARKLTKALAGAGPPPGCHTIACR
jgi:TonB family protein